MRRNVLYITATILTVLVASCSPMDDEYWVNNEIIKTSWLQANPETGRRPVGLADYTVFFYPQIGEVRYYEYNIPDEEITAEVPAGKYDAMLTQKSAFITGTEMYKTATVVLPTEYNERGEREIILNPDEMIYGGVMGNIEVIESERTIHTFSMQKLLKQIDFIITVQDSTELVKDCMIDISGLATWMRIYNQELDDSQATLKFPINKYGRSIIGENYCSTFYKGRTYLLGRTGNNILEVTFYDCNDNKRTLPIDITSFLKNWNTEEVTVNILINAIDNSINISEWSSGSSSDLNVDL